MRTHARLGTFGGVLLTGALLLTGCTSTTNQPSPTTAPVPSVAAGTATADQRAAAQVYQDFLNGLNRVSQTELTKVNDQATTLAENVQQPTDADYNRIAKLYLGAFPVLKAINTNGEQADQVAYAYLNALRGALLIQQQLGGGRDVYRVDPTKLQVNATGTRIGVTVSALKLISNPNLRPETEEDQVLATLKSVDGQWRIDPASLVQAEATATPSPTPTR